MRKGTTRLSRGEGCWLIAAARIRLLRRTPVALTALPVRRRDWSPWAPLGLRRPAWMCVVGQPCRRCETYMEVRQRDLLVLAPVHVCLSVRARR